MAYVTVCMAHLQMPENETMDRQYMTDGPLYQTREDAEERIRESEKWCSGPHLVVRIND